MTRTIFTHEALREGFWLALYPVRHGAKGHVLQPPSLPVARQAWLAKTDVIGIKMPLRTLTA